MQALYQTPGIDPCSWLSPATDNIVAWLLTRYIVNSAGPHSRSRDTQAAVFLDQLISSACGPFSPFSHERLGGNTAVTRCQAIFRQSIQDMDILTSIDYFTLFTKTKFSVAVAVPLFNELRQSYRDKRQWEECPYMRLGFDGYFLVGKVLAWGIRGALAFEEWKRS